MTAPNPAVQQQGMAVVSADNFNTFVQTVRNYAQLRTFVGLSNMVVYVQGASAPDDGGQALYYYNAASLATDNNSTVIVPTGNIQGAWLQLPVNINVSNLTGILPIANGGTGNGTGAVSAAQLTGVVPAANGGADSINGVLSANGSGLVTQGATTGLSDVSAPGSWTPVDGSGASLIFTSPKGFYAKIGSLVVAQFTVGYPSNANGSIAIISGLPFPSINTSASICGSAFSNAASNTILLADMGPSASSIFFTNIGGSNPTNAILSGLSLTGFVVYVT